MLEDIPLKKNETTRVKTKRCPHCGAVMSDMEQVCPECGQSLSEEADATMRVRQIIKETSDKLDAITKSRRKIKKDLEDSGEIDVDEDVINEEIARRKVDVINAFSVPFTSSALIQAYMFANGNYCSKSSKNSTISDYEDYDSDISKAWLGKAKEFYGLIQSIPNPDQQTQLWLKNNGAIMKIKGRKVLTVGGWIGTILIITGIIALNYLIWGYLSWASFWKVCLSFYIISFLAFISFMPAKSK